MKIGLSHGWTCFQEEIKCQFIRLACSLRKLPMGGELVALCPSRGYFYSWGLFRSAAFYFEGW